MTFTNANTGGPSVALTVSPRVQLTVCLASAPLTGLTETDPLTVCLTDLEAGQLDLGGLVVGGVDDLALDIALLLVGHPARRLRVVRLGRVDSLLLQRHETGAHEETNVNTYFVGHRSLTLL